MDIAPRVDGDVAPFHPQEFKRRQAKVEAIIDYAIKVKDWPLLEDAIREKVSEQRQLVDWWDDFVREKGERANVPDRGHFVWQALLPPRWHGAGWPPGNAGRCHATAGSGVAAAAAGRAGLAARGAAATAGGRLGARHMTVAGLNELWINEKPPGVGALGRLELNQAGAWGMRYEVVTSLSMHSPTPESRGLRLCLHACGPP